MSHSMAALIILALVAGTGLAAEDTQPPEEKIVDGPTAAQQGKVRRPDATVVYADFGVEKMRMDAFLPSGKGAKGSRPAVLFIHGGGWRGQSRQDWYWWCRDLADRGYVAFTLDYRLAREKPVYHPYPAAVDDCQRAVRWIRANAEEYGVDPERIASVGCSAGGHLSAMLGVLETRDNSDPVLAEFSSRVNAVVDYFGPLDLTDLGSPQNNAIARQFLGGKTSSEAPEVYREASPVNHVDRNSAPFLILHGKGDTTPYWHAEKMTELLRKAGVEITLVSPRGGHGFHWNRETEPARQAWAAVLDFLQKRFAARPLTSPPPAL